MGGNVIYTFNNWRQICAVYLIFIHNATLFKQVFPSKLPKNDGSITGIWFAFFSG